MNDHNADKPFRRWMTIVVSVFLGVLLAPWVNYLVIPNKSLFDESGWLSYSEDRSSRISFLLWYGADPNRYVTRGYTSLHTAIHWGSLDATKQLLEAGADANRPTADGSWLPLDIACEFGRDDDEIISLLVENGGSRKRSHPQNSHGVTNPSACFDLEKVTTD